MCLSWSEKITEVLPSTLNSSSQPQLLLYYLRTKNNSNLQHEKYLFDGITLENHLSIYLVEAKAEKACIKLKVVEEGVVVRVL